MERVNQIASIRISITCVLLGMLFFPMYGQFNIKIGYSFNILSASENNALLDAFNMTKGNEIDLEIPFSNLNSMHGIHLGSRFLLGNSNAFEFTWENMSRKRQAVGENQDGSLFQTELFYSFNQYMIGYQSYFGNWGLGSGFGYNNVSVRDRIANSDFKNTIISDGQWIARINLSLNFGQNENVSLSLQPFVQFPITSISLDPLASELNVESTDTINESFFNYGVSLIFYNGRQ